VQREKPNVESDPARKALPGDLATVDETEAARVARAVKVLSSTTDREQNMLVDKKAIAVIPGVKNGASFSGGQWGKGLLSMRDYTGRWIPPSFIQVTGGNFGLQAGYENTDLVLVFTDESAVESLLKGTLTLNVAASAASPVADREINAGTPVLLKGGIYAYSMTKGVFADIWLDGSTISIDNTANEKVYGKNVDGEAILKARRVDSNATVAPFIEALEKYPSQQIPADRHGQEIRN
jgi:lipid-binding SYLF domain-containing protein